MAMTDVEWRIRGDQWQITLAESSALFEAMPPMREGGADGTWQLRVNTGVGWGIPLTRVASLVEAIGEVLDQPEVRRWLATRTYDGTGWWHPGIDRTERVLYLRGPVVARDDSQGYHLATQVEIAFQDLPGLRARLIGVHHVGSPLRAARHRPIARPRTT
jgi:hypothetical protein